jgi:glycine/D-amino acid oxidase-like deaminating enzyme
MAGSSNDRLRQVLGTLRNARAGGDHGADTYDCVVIGGGFLGLTALAQLRRQGYRAVLCTESGLGEGQSLHSHGWFHAGYLPKDVDAAAMWKTESAKTEAFVASLGADFLRPGCAYLAMPAGDADAKIAQSAAVGVPMPAVAPGKLPGSSGGPLAEASTSCFETREWLFDKHRLTAALAAEHHDAIITYASPTNFERGPDGSVKAVVLSTNQRLATRSVAIAAGTGTRRVVDMLGADVDAHWKSKFKSGTITMVCLNAPVGVLPDLAIMATTTPPLQVASRADDGDTITWYITPKRPEDSGDPTNFVGPGNEEAEIEAEAVAHAVEDFRTLFPELAKVRANLTEVLFAYCNVDVSRACSLKGSFS